MANDNIVQLGVKPKPNSPAAEELGKKNEEEFYAEQKENVLSFLAHHLKYIQENEDGFEGHGAFLVIWNKDQNYILNDVGAFPMATMCGLLDLAKQDFLVRHIMGNSVRPSDPKED